jgi:hypothetical protein
MSKWQRELCVLLINDEQELKNLRMWYKLGCDPKMVQVSEKPRLDDDKVDIAWKNRCPSKFDLLETVFSAILFAFTICMRCVLFAFTICMRCVPSNMSGIPSPGEKEDSVGEHSLYTILPLVHKYHLDLEEEEGSRSQSYDYEFLWWNGKRSSA